MLKLDANLSFDTSDRGCRRVPGSCWLDGYEVIDNVIKSDGQAIHCWRFSKNGTVADNLRVHDTEGKPVVVVNSPSGWQPPEPPTQRNNRNHLARTKPGRPPK